MIFRNYMNRIQYQFPSPVCRFPLSLSAVPCPAVPEYALYAERDFREMWLRLFRKSGMKEMDLFSAV